VFTRDIQLTKNIAPPCRGKTTPTSHDGEEATWTEPEFCVKALDRADSLYGPTIPLVYVHKQPFLSSGT
jgi:hypothetical protein